MQVITDAADVQVEFDGKTLWVNVHGRCRLRIGTVDNLEYIVHGDLVYSTPKEQELKAE